MHRTVHGTNVTRRRHGLEAAFFLIGLVFASWVSRLAAVRHDLGLDNAEMGLLLFTLAVGAMTGILASGVLTSRFGTRRLIVSGTTSIIGGAALIAGGTAVSQPLLVAVGLVAMGAGIGAAEIAANIDGADVERASGRALLPRLHGFFSLGALAGAVGGILAESSGVAVSGHLLAVAVLAVAILWPARGTFAGGVGRRPTRRNSAGPRRRGSVVFDRPLMLISLVVLAMAFAEGAANDWLPLVMVDGHGVSRAGSTVFYAGFVAATAVGRFAGNPLVDRFGKMPLLQASGLTAAVGVALVVFAADLWLAGAGALVWGLGVSLGFPVALSAAGESGDKPESRVSTASTIGYVAFLVGPPSLGFVGEHVGLRVAVGSVLVVAVLATLAARAVPRAAMIHVTPASHH